MSQAAGILQTPSLCASGSSGKECEDDELKVSMIAVNCQNGSVGRVRLSPLSPSTSRMLQDDCLQLRVKAVALYSTPLVSFSVHPPTYTRPRGAYSEP